MNPATRRDFLGTSASLVASPLFFEQPGFSKDKDMKLRHSVVGWCFQNHGEKWDPDTLCQKAKIAGCVSVELTEPAVWPVIAKHGLSCAIALAGTKGGFTSAWNNSALHPELMEQSKATIEKCAANRIERVIAFVGMRWRDPTKPGRDEISMEEAANSCLKGWKELAKVGEKNGVTVCVEHLNSRVSDHPMKGHPGYQGDDLDWVAKLIRQVDSPRLKLLFDVYHVQIMHGDILRRLDECKDIIGHIHTAGNPGRAEMDDTQEINYPAVGAKLAAMNYPGFVGHEFIPTREPSQGLREAIQICEGKRA